MLLLRLLLQIILYAIKLLLLIILFYDLFSFSIFSWSLLGLCLKLKKIKTIIARVNLSEEYKRLIVDMKNFIGTSKFMFISINKEILL